jgi:hypothetical protein
MTKGRPVHMGCISLPCILQAVSYASIHQPEGLGLVFHFHEMRWEFFFFTRKECM